VACSIQYFQHSASDLTGTAGGNAHDRKRQPTECNGSTSEDHRAQIIGHAVAGLIHVNILPVDVEVVEVPAELVVAHVDNRVVAPRERLCDVRNALPDVDDDLLRQGILQGVNNGAWFSEPVRVCWGRDLGPGHGGVPRTLK
jgi:hypothetical protein